MAEGNVGSGSVLSVASDVRGAGQDLLYLSDRARMPGEVLLLASSISISVMSTLEPPCGMTIAASVVIPM